MKNFAQQDAGFSNAQTDAQYDLYVRFADLVEQNFWDRSALLKLKAALVDAEGALAERDRENLLSRCDYYLWDLGRATRDETGFVSTGDASEESEE